MIRRLAGPLAIAALCAWTIAPAHAQTGKVTFDEVMKNMTKCNVDSVRALISGVGINQISTGQQPIDPSGLKGPDGTPLIVAAAATDCTEGVHELLNNGAQVTDTDARGNTPLHMAAASSKSSMVQLLVEKDADVNAKNAKGETPLTLAHTNNYKGKTEEQAKIIAYLTKKGAK